MSIKGHCVTPNLLFRVFHKFWQVLTSFLCMACIRFGKIFIWRLRPVTFLCVFRSTDQGHYRSINTECIWCDDILLYKYQVRPMQECTLGYVYKRAHCATPNLWFGHFEKFWQVLTSFLCLTSNGGALLQRTPVKSTKCHYTLAYVDRSPQELSWVVEEALFLWL